MSGMRNIGEENKQSFRTLVEVVEALGDLKGRLARHKPAFVLNGRGRPKKPTAAAILSAVVLRVAAMPPAERNRFVEEGMAEYNRLLQLDAPEPEKAGFGVRVVPATEAAGLRGKTAKKKPPAAKPKAPRKGRA